MSARWYEFRGFSPDTVRAARAWYVRFLPASGRLLDVGCGRGEFLDVAAAAGLEVEGVDQDSDMLAHASHHRVHEGDALDFLQSTPHNYDAISALHVVEHMPVDRVVALVRLAASQLKPGGMLLVATPNPGSWPTIAHEFWRDPDHVRPYDVELLHFFCGEAGLEVEASGVNPESPRGLPVELDDLTLHPAAPPDQPLSTSEGGPLAAWLGGQMAGSPYARDLEAAIHSLAADLQHTRDELSRVSGLLRRFLEVAYEPSEVYVVAKKPT